VRHLLLLLLLALALSIRSPLHPIASDVGFHYQLVAHGSNIFGQEHGSSVGPSASNALGVYKNIKEKYEPDELVMEYYGKEKIYYVGDVRPENGYRLVEITYPSQLSYNLDTTPCTLSAYVSEDMEGWELLAKRAVGTLYIPEKYKFLKLVHVEGNVCEFYVDADIPADEWGNHILREISFLPVRLYVEGEQTDFHIKSGVLAIAPGTVTVRVESDVPLDYLNVVGCDDLNVVYNSGLPPYENGIPPSAFTFKCHLFGNTAIKLTAIKDAEIKEMGPILYDDPTTGLYLSYTISITSYHPEKTSEVNFIYPVDGTTITSNTICLDVRPSPLWDPSVVAYRVDCGGGVLREENDALCCVFSSPGTYKIQIEEILRNSTLVRGHVTVNIIKPEELPKEVVVEPQEKREARKTLIDSIMDFIRSLLDALLSLLGSTALKG